MLRFGRTRKGREETEWGGIKGDIRLMWFYGNPLPSSLSGLTLVCYHGDHQPRSGVVMVSDVTMVTVTGLGRGQITMSIRPFPVVGSLSHSPLPYGRMGE